MSPEPRRLQALGTRVRVSTVTAADIEPYRRAVEMSTDRLSRWNPVDPHDLSRHLAAQSAGHRTFVIHALDAAGSHGLVGKVNVSNIVRGRFQNATIGYDSYDPYAGRGLFAEGLRLVIDLAFAPEPQGLGLHRIEANVQPGNGASMGVLRSLGFRREGRVDNMLWLTGPPDGAPAWRKHDAHAVTADEWPAPAHQPHRPARLAVLVNGLPGSGKTTLGRALSRELGIPLLSKDVVKETFFDHLSPALQEQAVGQGGGGSALGPGAGEVLWRLLADSPVGAVVENFWWVGDETYARAGLERSGFDLGSVAHVWCDVPIDAARGRYEQRVSAGERHPVHGDEVGLDQMWAQVGEYGRPMQVGQLLQVDTTRELTAREVTRIGLAVRGIAG